MSGPVSPQDASPEGPSAGVARDVVVEVSEARPAEVGGMPVRRTLPRRGRRTVGAWCFVDHFGPAQATRDRGVEIGPHPHIGLHTVTWVLEGRQVHRDSLGSEQVVRPGQLNLMTAGHGVVHAEESLDYLGPVHGVQLWVAQPESTRHGPPAFEHHGDLPRVGIGSSTATVLVGAFAGEESKARTDTPLVGVDLELPPGTTTVPLNPSYEHCVVVVEGAVDAAGAAVGPDAMAYLGTGREEIRLATPAGSRVLLLGGTPFEAPILMWWNFVARTRDEVVAAQRAWAHGDDRFGPVASTLPRIPAPAPPWGP